MLKLAASLAAAEPERARFVLEPERADRGRIPIVSERDVGHVRPSLRPKQDRFRHKLLVDYVVGICDELPENSCSLHTASTAAGAKCFSQIGGRTN